MNIVCPSKICCFFSNSDNYTYNKNYTLLKICLCGKLLFSLKNIVNNR